MTDDGPSLQVDLVFCDEALDCDDDLTRWTPGPDRQTAEQRYFSTFHPSGLRILCRNSSPRRNLDDMFGACTEVAYQLVFDRQHLPGQGRTPWLFVVSGTSWLPKDRIVRSKKLHWSLQHVHGWAPFEGPEVEFESEHGLSYAGLLALDSENFRPAVEILCRQGSGALVISDRIEPTGSAVTELFQQAFPEQQSSLRFDWLNLISARCEQGDVVGRATGRWSEGECSLDLYGPQDVLRSFTSTPSGPS